MIIRKVVDGVFSFETVPGDIASMQVRRHVSNYSAVTNQSISGMSFHLETRVPNAEKAVGAEEQYLAKQF